MKKGPNMGRMSRTQLTVAFLLTAALCLEATLIYSLHLTDKMRWAEAREYCQKEYVDLITWHALDKKDLSVLGHQPADVWIGLVRDQELDSVWRWIDLESGNGTTGEDVSQSSNWATTIDPSPHCGLFSEDFAILSRSCLKKNPFYCSEGSDVFHCINLTWYEASDFCQAFNSHLAVVDTMNTNEFHWNGWIGLYRVGGDNWRWVGNVSSNYNTKWEISTHLTTVDCTVIHLPNNDTFYSKPCGASHPAICFTDNLVVVNERKTWDEAVKHCRDLEVTCDSTPGHCRNNYDLLSLSYWSDHIYTRIKMAKASTDEVWTGLRFLGGRWWWLNGAEVQHDALPGCPPRWKHCGTLSRNDDLLWAIQDCSERRHFICARLELSRCFLGSNKCW